MGGESDLNKSSILGLNYIILVYHIIILYFLAVRFTILQNLHIYQISSCITDKRQSRL